MKTKSKKGLNPHYLEINVSPVVPLQQEKKKEENFNLCKDYVSKKEELCSVLNDETSKLSQRLFKVNNNSPVHMDVKISDNLVSRIPAGQSMLMYKKDNFNPIKNGDVLVIADCKTGANLFQKTIDANTQTINLGIAKFIPVNKDKETGMYITNYFNIPFEFWYGANRIGNLSPNSKTYVDLYREGFRTGDHVYLFSEKNKGYRLEVPEFSYGKSYEIIVGATE